MDTVDNSGSLNLTASRTGIVVKIYAATTVNSKDIKRSKELRKSATIKDGRKRRRRTYADASCFIATPFPSKRPSNNNGRPTPIVIFITCKNAKNLRAIVTDTV